jgi:hypothetical protein
MELIIYVPLHYVAMPQFMIIVIEVTFVSAPIILLLVLGPNHKLQGEHNLWVCMKRCLERRIKFLLVSHQIHEEALDPPIPPRLLGYYGWWIQVGHHYHQTCLIVRHLTILSMWRILTQMFMSKKFKLPLKQMVKQKMQKMLICLVLLSEILCLTSVKIIWEIT